MHADPGRTTVLKGKADEAAAGGTGHLSLYAELRQIDPVEVGPGKFRRVVEPGLGQMAVPHKAATGGHQLKTAVVLSSRAAQIMAAANAVEALVLVEIGQNGLGFRVPRSRSPLGHAEGHSGSRIGIALISGTHKGVDGVGRGLCERYHRRKK